MSKLSNNKFLKILLKCGVTYEELLTYDWDIEEIKPHCYHCIGTHPMLKRISYIKENIVIH